MCLENENPKNLHFLNPTQINQERYLFLPFSLGYKEGKSSL